MKKEIICTLSYIEIKKLMKKISKKGAIQFAMIESDSSSFDKEKYIMKGEKMSGGVRRCCPKCFSIKYYNYKLKTCDYCGYVTPKQKKLTGEENEQ